MLFAAQAAAAAAKEYADAEELRKEEEGGRSRSGGGKREEVHAAVRGLLSLEEAMVELEVLSLLALLAGTKVQILAFAGGGGGRARGAQFTCFTGWYKSTNTDTRAQEAVGELEVLGLIALMVQKCKY